MAFDLTELQARESLCRTRIATDPADFDSRLELAWCLFMQAASPAQGDKDTAPARFAEGLREALKVCRMSDNPAHQAEAARMTFLLGLLGEQEAIRLAERQVDGIMGQLARDLSAVRRPAASLGQEGRLHPKSARRAHRKPRPSL